MSPVAHVAAPTWYDAVNMLLNGACLQLLWSLRRR
jgi:hypothetical protein